MKIQDSMLGLTQADSMLPELWRRRSRLSPEEMEWLYLIVQRALARYHPPELHALGEDKDELVAQFLYVKVLHLDNSSGGHEESASHSAPSNAFALCAYFRRYLIDCLRSASFQRNVSLEVEAVRSEVDRRTSWREDSVDVALRDHDLCEEAVGVKARMLIASLDKVDRLLLAGTLGALSEKKGGLSELAANYRISSYHYHASKLGVVVKKGASPESFAETTIGRWIQEELGVEICFDNRVTIYVVLNILALEASRLQ